MNRIIAAALASLLVLSAVETASAQTTTPRDTAAAAAARDTVADTTEIAGPYRADTVPQSSAPCVREVRRIPPPPSPRSFRRQWPLAALGSIVGWFIGDRIVGPKGNPLVILGGSTVGAIAG
ncbi:MAG TPA: hypothetical protein VHG08_15115, partial [Longimicrobium sp.]|nr:hypothetical protein [Longimicrobium sp.]